MLITRTPSTPSASRRSVSEFTERMRVGQIEGQWVKKKLAT